MLGDGCRIGSNAVVLKDVPAGATVIGVPGRIVAAEPTAEHKRIEEMAKKMGFEAYGMHKHMSDPVANAINAMIEHIHQMDKKMMEMVTAIKGMGIDLPPGQVPELENCEIDSTINEVDAEPPRLAIEPKKE